MKLISIEYFTESDRIFDPTREDGMAKGVAEKIENLSYADGTVKLLSWDSENNMPLAFTYSKDMYLVEYRVYDPNDSMNGEWDVYYAIHVLNYKADK